MSSLKFTREKRIFNAQRWIETGLGNGHPWVSPETDNQYWGFERGPIKEHTAVCGYRQDPKRRSRIVIGCFYVQNDDGLTLQIPYDWIARKIKLLQAEYGRRHWWYDHLKTEMSKNPATITAEDLTVTSRWVSEALAEVGKCSKFLPQVNFIECLSDYTLALHETSLLGKPVKSPWITENLADRPARQTWHRWSILGLRKHWIPIPRPSGWPRAIFDMPNYSDQDNLPPVVWEHGALLANEDIPRVMMLHACHEQSPTYALVEEMKTFVQVLEREVHTKWWRRSSEKGRYRQSWVTLCLPWLKPDQRRRTQDARGVWHDAGMN